ncbi:signal peptidase I [Cellulomonas sp. Y8]|uniref:signal peptidase I n=1 Tax=Cellulomonas sp. Y8 TaxID=2591145 RepID=UPI0011CA54B2|nr:signal peptidase I [Cellulomonas sp. Y8]
MTRGPRHARPGAGRRCARVAGASRRPAWSGPGDGVVVERLARRLVDVAAVAGVLCAAAVAALLLAGWRPVVLVSGSMAPAMPAGSLVLARPVPAAEVRVGDVVTVPLPGSATPVTHRVAAVRSADGELRATLRGDANAADDPHEYVLPARTHRAALHVPRAGLLVTGAPGTVLVAGAATLVLLAVLPARPGSSATAPPGVVRSRAR